METNISDLELACNHIRFMFHSKHYSKVVPNKDINVMLNSPNWIKIYGKDILQEAWNKLVNEGYVNKKLDVWFWGIEYQNTL